MDAQLSPETVLCADVQPHVLQRFVSSTGCCCLQIKIVFYNMHAMSTDGYKGNFIAICQKMHCGALFPLQCLVSPGVCWFPQCRAPFFASLPAAACIAAASKHYQQQHGKTRVMK